MWTWKDSQHHADVRAELGHVGAEKLSSGFVGDLAVVLEDIGRHLAGDRWFVDETYVKVAGVWSYVYRAVDQHAQVIDVYVSQRRDIASARTFFTAALAVHGDPAEVITDRAPALASVIEELLPASVKRRPGVDSG